ncbi:hypothetical protein [Devosia sp. 2618]|uniref:hypothetical protein n=1 Tax=Devosia sp. 2618 TaxID=3156454 RepID=UPI003390D17F
MSVNTKIVRLSGLTLCALAFSAGASIAQDLCAGIDVPLTDQLKQEYVALTSAALKEDAPGKIDVDQILASGDWSVASFSPQNLEDGYAFFEEKDGTKMFQDVWGGVAMPDEGPEVASWVETLGAPADLAACFADQVTGEE